LTAGNCTAVGADCPSRSSSASTLNVWVRVPCFRLRKHVSDPRTTMLSQSRRAGTQGRAFRAGRGGRSGIKTGSPGVKPPAACRSLPARGRSSARRALPLAREPSSGVHPPRRTYFAFPPSPPPNLAAGASAHFLARSSPMTAANSLAVEARSSLIPAGASSRANCPERTLL